MNQNLIKRLAAAGADVSKVRDILESKGTMKGSLEGKVAGLASVNDLTELYGMLHSANGGKSKAKGSKNAIEAVNRYESQIKAIKERINEVLAMINQGDDVDKVTLARKYNMPTKTILDSYVLPMLQTRLDAQLDSLATQEGITKVQVKQILNSLPATINEGLKASLEDLGVYSEFVSRLESGDNRVVAIARKAALLLQ